MTDARYWIAVNGASAAVTATRQPDDQPRPGHDGDLPMDYVWRPPSEMDSNDEVMFWIRRLEERLSRHGVAAWIPRDITESFRCTEAEAAVWLARNGQRICEAMTVAGWHWIDDHCPFPPVDDPHAFRGGRDNDDFDDDHDA